MKHLHLFEEQSINPPILSMFTEIEDLWAFLNKYPEIEEMFDKNPQLEFILPKNEVMAKRIWDQYYTGNHIFCLYAPMNDVDTVVTYRLKKSHPSELNELYGYGARWESEYYKGQDTKGSFWELVNSPEYQDLYIKYGLDLIAKGDLRKYLDIFSGFALNNLDNKILDMAIRYGLDTEDFKRKLKGIKLLMRK